jgi:hypothetical protein
MMRIKEFMENVDTNKNTFVQMKVLDKFNMTTYWTTFIYNKKKKTWYDNLDNYKVNDNYEVLKTIVF